MARRCAQWRGLNKLRPVHTQLLVDFAPVFLYYSSIEILPELTIIVYERQGLHMEMKIGQKIFELRRVRGLTQEQLADELGVSAAAVSKWETDNSYPDITLLCPLARALGTNVDTLLQFEQTLPDEAVVGMVNEIMEKIQSEGYERGEQTLSERLRQYPNSSALKFNAALVMDSLLMMFPDAPEEKKARWTKQKQLLLTKLRETGRGAYWEVSTLNLAGLAIRDGRLDQAEQLLKELPEQTTDASLIWVQFYMMKEDFSKALDIVQKKLFSLVMQVENCLGIMTDKRLTADDEQILEICMVYKGVADLFGCGALYEGLLMEFYLRLGRLEDAVASFERYAEALDGKGLPLKKALFAPAFTEKSQQPTASKGMLRAVIKAMEGEEYRALTESTRGRAAMEKLEKALARAN